MASPPKEVTKAASARRSLAIYCISALCVRMVDAGAGVGLLLLARSALAPDTATRTGGFLVALFTVPHLAGPILARRLDVARDYRRLLGAAYLLMALVLTASTLSVGRLPTPLVGVLIVLAGFGGPLLTGGLSSRLADLVPASDAAQRRAQGMDATTYGLAGTAGPALVAALAGGISAQVAMLTLCSLALVSAGLVQLLPRGTAQDLKAVPKVRDVLPLVVTDPPLRRVNYQTMTVAAGQAGLAVIAVQLAGPYAVKSSTTALLLSAMGAGNLLAALVLSARPLTGNPDRLTTRQVGVIAVCFGLCALAPSFGFGIAAFALMGIATAPFVTATFAARNSYAPEQARAQVFVTLAALKISAATAGTALAGLLIGLGPTRLLVLAGVAVLISATASVIDRRITSASSKTPP